MDLYDELRVLNVDCLLSYMRASASNDCCVAMLDLVNVRIARRVESTSWHVCLARIVINTRTVHLRHIFEGSIGSYVAIFQINLVQKMLKIALVQARLL